MHLLFSVLTLLGVYAQAASDSFTCVAQLDRAYDGFLQTLPEAGPPPIYQFVKSKNGASSAQVLMDFPELNSESKKLYQLKLDLLLTPKASLWNPERDRIEMTLQVIDKETGQVIAAHRDSSDHLWTPMMASWAQRNESVKILAVAYNPAVLSAIQNSQDSEVQAARESLNYDLTVQVAVKRKVVPLDVVHRAQVVCETTKKN